MACKKVTPVLYVLDQTLSSFEFYVEAKYTCDPPTLNPVPNALLKTTDNHKLDL